MHRACESSATELVDNDNDGVADASPEEHCSIYEPDPASGEGHEPDPEDDVEEDMFWASSVPITPGKTAWSQMGVDMLCNSYGLALVSGDGLTHRSVRQELIFNAASCWTRQSDGGQASDHPQASTQLRIVLRDDDWGAPRPRECFDWDDPSNEWVCNGTAGCVCVDDMPLPGPVGPQ